MWDKTRIEEEGKLVDSYGLRNMRELWRAQTMLRRIRREARALLSGNGENIEQRSAKLLSRVKSFLIRGEATLDGVLGLTTSDVIERRLQTIVVRKGMATTPTQARQFITHGHIAVDGHKVTSPGHIVSFVGEAGVEWYGKPLIAAKPVESVDAVEEPAAEAAVEAVEEPAVDAEEKVEAKPAKKEKPVEAVEEKA